VQRLRRLALALGLGCGVLALVLGLVHLHGIFVEERDDALAAVGARREALEQYAARDLARRLADRLAEARAGIEQAARDPLLPAAELWLVDRGEQILPRTAGPQPGGSASATELYRTLAAGGVETLRAAAEREEPGSPWSERLGLFAELARAAALGDAEATERAVRSILSHRARFVLPAPLDIPLEAAILELLVRRMRPSPELVRALVRDGLSMGLERIEGLERRLLRHRGRFSAGDLHFLAGRITELARAGGVLYADFSARVSEPIAPRLEAPVGLREPAVVHGGWYVEPMGSDRLFGTRADLAANLGEVASAMRERGLLEEGDALALREPPRAAVVPVRALAVEVRSPRWAPQLEAARARYRLKAALEAAIALLAFGVVGLGLALMRRERRFVELKAEFVGAVSHELRTPLASIRLMAETLERRTRELAAVRDYPARIVRVVDGLRLLVENILSFSRLSRGGWAPRCEEVRLADLARRLAEEPELWARRPAELSTEGLDALVVRADAELVYLCLANLARNGVAYNEREPATVHVSAERTGGGIRVRVRDNGTGIPRGEARRVFDDFYRGRGASGGGSGLGLAICRKIMEAHGGSIAVAETGPEGTTFELVFPVEAEADPEARA
jgi:signal transduction histidine kinase